VRKLLPIILVVSLVAISKADTLQWDTPFGHFNLNLSTTEALLGYDAILKQAIGGMSLPIYSTPKHIVDLQLGAVAPWPTNGPTFEPYVAAGHDILRDIPALANLSACHLNVFGRYATNQGKAGLGVSFSYAFASN